MKQLDLGPLTMRLLLLLALLIPYNGGIVDGSDEKAAGEQQQPHQQQTAAELLQNPGMENAKIHIGEAEQKYMESIIVHYTKMYLTAKPEDIITVVWLIDANKPFEKNEATLWMTDHAINVLEFVFYIRRLLAHEQHNPLDKRTWMTKIREKLTHTVQNVLDRSKSGKQRRASTSRAKDMVKIERNTVKEFKKKHEKLLKKAMYGQLVIVPNKMLSTCRMSYKREFDPKKCFENKRAIELAEAAKAPGELQLIRQEVYEALDKTAEQIVKQGSANADLVKIALKHYHDHIKAMAAFTEHAKGEKANKEEPEQLSVAATANAAVVSVVVNQPRPSSVSEIQEELDG